MKKLVLLAAFVLGIVTLAAVTKPLYSPDQVLISDCSTDGGC